MQEFLLDRGLAAMADLQEQVYWAREGRRVSVAELEDVEQKLDRLQRQLFLQLHHVLDEVNQGMPIDDRSLKKLLLMLNTSLGVIIAVYLTRRWGEGGRRRQPQK